MYNNWLSNKLKHFCHCERLFDNSESSNLWDIEISCTELVVQMVGVPQFLRRFLPTETRHVDED